MFYSVLFLLVFICGCHIDYLLFRRKWKCCFLYTYHSRVSLITCVCISQTDSHDVKIGDSVVGHHQLVDAVGWSGSNPGYGVGQSVLRCNKSLSDYSRVFPPHGEPWGQWTVRKCLNASRTDPPGKINKGSVTVLSFLNIYFVLNYVCDVCVSLWDMYRCLSREKSASDLKLQAIVSCPKWGWEPNSNPL